MKKLLLIVILVTVTLITLAQKRTHHEVYYQDNFSRILTEQGFTNETEVTLSDRTRCDIVTEKYAIEVDFANKWAEGIGQSLHYGLLLNKKPAVLLIMEDLDKDVKYLERLKNVANRHCITVFVISTDLRWNEIEL